MNAQQRRADQRRWRYQVVLGYAQLDRNGYDCMFNWCRDTFGNRVSCSGWREKHQHFGTCWQFTSAKKAELFALRWT